jgi:MerR family transcriptional regulator/heat shock protein HspR
VASTGGFSVGNPDAPVFVISVAAQLSGMHPQTLRSYDRMGLVSPGRAGGGGRRYSLRDVERLRVVAELTSAGIGIEGVRRILHLENQVLALQARVAELEDELTSAMQTALPNLPVLRATAALTRYRPGPFPATGTRPTEQRSAVSPSPTTKPQPGTH